MTKNKGIIVLVFVTIFWSYGFIATQMAIDANIKVPAILCFRFLIAALMIGIINHKRIKLLSKPTIKRGIAAGFIMFWAYYTQTLGQDLAPISIVALISSSYVVFVPILNWIFNGEKPVKLTMLMSSIAMLGMIILNYDGSRFVFDIGAIFVFISSIAFAMHVSFVDIYCAQENIFDQSFVQLLCAGVMSFIAMIITDSIPTQFESTQGLLGILYLALFSSGLCTLLQILGQKHVPAANSAIILSVEGVFACILSIILGYESFKLNMLFGGILILFSAIFINVKEAREQIS